MTAGSRVGTVQFGRVIQVTAGPEGGGSGRTWSGFALRGQAKPRNGLAIKFDIDRNDKKKPSPGKVTLYNLNEASRALLGVGASVSVKAGYSATGKEDQPVIFSGEISKAQHVWDLKEREWTTEIEARDGGSVWDEASLSESFVERVSAEHVLTRVAGRAGLPLALAPGLPAFEFEGGLVASGMLREALSKVCEMARYDWSIQDGTLLVTGRDEPGPGEIYLIDASQILDVKLVEKKKGQKGSAGLSIKVNLNPLIRPKDQVMVESKTASGLYKVKAIKHTGETWGDAFESELEVVPA